MKPRLSQRRKEEIWPRQAPNNLALRASSYSGDKKSRCSPIDCPAAAAREFMQGGKCKPTARQCGVYLRNAKRQISRVLCTASFESGNALSKVRYDRVCSVVRHCESSSERVSISRRSEYVPFLFLIGN
jgi:hypothetical protein